MAFSMKQQLLSSHRTSTCHHSGRCAGAPRSTLAAAASVRRHHLPAPLSQRQQQAATRLQLQQQQQQRLLVVYAAAPNAAAAGEEDGLDPNIPAVDQDFDLLSAEIKKLQGSLKQELKGCSIYLIGMMGSGKSTTGQMVANTLK